MKKQKNFYANSANNSTRIAGEDEPHGQFESLGYSRERAADKFEEYIQESLSNKSIGVDVPFYCDGKLYKFAKFPDGRICRKVLNNIALSQQYRDINEKTLDYYEDFYRDNNIISYKEVISCEGGDFVNTFERPPFTALDYKNDYATILQDISEIENSLSLVKHIFGDKFHLGLQYLANLVQHPNQALPVLCLVSEKQRTGKSTLGNYLQWLLGGCVKPYSMADLLSDFNECETAHVSIFEEMSNTKKCVDKLKRMATQITTTLNEKHEKQRVVEVCNHVIICSNNECGFIKADCNDVRYWVFRVPSLTTWIPNFDNKLKAEARAFFYFLATYDLPSSRDRLYFSKEEIESDALDRVRVESLSDLSKNIILTMFDYFKSDVPLENKVYADAMSIKTEINDRGVSLFDVRNALKNELKLKPMKQTRCLIFNKKNEGPKNCRPYVFDYDFFIKYKDFLDFDGIIDTEKETMVESNTPFIDAPITNGDIVSNCRVFSPQPEKTQSQMEEEYKDILDKL